MAINKWSVIKVPDNYIILEGNDLTELVSKGLKKLNKTKEEVNIEILENGKQLMGIAIKKYKIKLTVKDIGVSEIKNTIEAIEKLEDGFDSDFEIEYRSDGVYLLVNIDSSRQIYYEDVLKKIKYKKIEDYDIKAIRSVVINREKEPIKIAPAQIEVPIDADIVIDISKDKMNGFMTLVPPDGGSEMDLNKALSIINDKIKYGIEYDKVKKIISDKQYHQKILIAKGLESINGKDGYIEYRFKHKESNIPAILEDGSVDYRNLGLITNVNKGDILAEIFKPTKGTEGKNVIGEIISNKTGKDVVIKKGKNVIISDDEKYLIAETDGHVYIDNGKLTVQKVYEVQSNVDNSTGNIKFNGALRIRGSVLTGFEVAAEGDIEIEGVVEGANVQTEGGIIIKRGIQGYNKAKLIALGDVTSRFIENCYIESKGSVNAEAIMHSEISSKESIIVKGKKGLIVGGICRASKEIHAKTIGSSMATVTVLEVGIDPGLRSKQEQIKNEIESVTTDISKLDKTINLLNRQLKRNELNNDKKQLLIKSLQAKTFLSNKLKELKSKSTQLDFEIDNFSYGKIKVENVIYPGVKITIGNSVMYVREEIKHCTVYNEEGSIKVRPYEN